MPGSKRRALKNLLSPHTHSTSSPSTSPSASSTSLNAPASANSSLAPADEIAIVEGMEARQHLISPQPGLLPQAEAQAAVNVPTVNVNGYAPPLSPPQLPASQVPVDGNPIATNTGEQLSASASPPRRRSLGGFAGLYSRNNNKEVTTADELLAGASGDGKKKKSSKQRFAEREVRARLPALHSYRLVRLLTPFVYGFPHA